MFRRPFLLIVVLVAFLAASGFVVAGTSSHSICREVELTQKPGWTVSGAWLGKQLVLVDALDRTLLRYSARGDSLGPIQNPLEGTLKNMRPITGKLRGSDLILEVSDGFLTLDNGRRPTLSKKVVYADGIEGHQTIGGIWQWEPASNDIVAFADLQGPGREEWTGALVRFPLDNPSHLTVLKRVAVRDDERTFFRTAFPYIATLGDTAYVLSMENRMGLFKNPSGSDQLFPLRSFAPGPTLSPFIPHLSTKDDFVTLMSIIEKSTLPVGLYAWDKYLYILSRSPSGEGTRWTLSKIDPQDDYLGSVELPTNAHHLTVVPGHTWAFVEKGSVLGYGLQDIPTALLIPDQTLQAAFSSPQDTLCK